MTTATSAPAAPLPRRVTTWPLVGALYFMVAGGPYGLEEIIHKAGYGPALLFLAITPLLWSVPTALMVAELSAAIPEEGGFYVWVRRAMGPFWGFIEAWLSFVASIFDVAIYPTLFVLYLGRIFPALNNPDSVMVFGVTLLAACAAMNIGGARAVGDASLVFLFALLAPFVAFFALAWWNPAAPQPQHGVERLDLIGGLLVAMWNYTGWDNASTIGGEVDRPRRTYPLALGIAVALVTATYLLPVWAASRTGIDPAAWTTGSWVDAGRAIGGPVVAVAIAAGGIICGAGMLNALMLSNSRLPMVLAEYGYLPRVLARRHSKTDAPWVSILLCAVLWSAALRLGFERLVEMAVLLFGLSMVLEFIALVVLRLREPDLPRPFRVPGGVPGAILVGIPPTALVLIGIPARTDRTNGFHEPACVRHGRDRAGRVHLFHQPAARLWSVTRGR